MFVERRRVRPHQVARANRDEVRQRRERRNIETCRITGRERQEQTAPGKTDRKEDRYQNSREWFFAEVLGRCGGRNDERENQQHTHDLYRLGDRDREQQYEYYREHLGRHSAR